MLGQPVSLGPIHVLGLHRVRPARHLRPIERFGSVSVSHGPHHDPLGRAEQVSHLIADAEHLCDEPEDLPIRQHGYHATTIGSLAKAAEVSPQTIYNSIGGRADLVKSVYDILLAGDDEPVPMSSRPEFLARFVG